MSAPSPSLSHALARPATAPAASPTVAPGISAHWTWQASDQRSMGVEVDSRGVHFAVYSEHARAIWLCIFDETGKETQYPMFGPKHGVYHGYLLGAKPGLRYGYRAEGEYRPDHGAYFDRSNLLLDPYAKAIVGTIDIQQLYRKRHAHAAAGGNAQTHAHAAASSSVQTHAQVAAGGSVQTHAQVAAGDSVQTHAQVAAGGSVQTHAQVAAGDSVQTHALQALVLAPQPAVDCGMLHADDQVVLYEVHAKGFSQSWPEIPEAMRGTMAALAHPLAIAHFQRIGVTTLSLLPIQYALSEQHLALQHKRNYWGYNTLAFFCLDPNFFASTDPLAQQAEFRQTVATLRQAGIEVVLDIVFNHSAEAGSDGPCLSFRGLDNRSWYVLNPHNLAHYENFSGCGNSLNLAHPMVLRWTLDCLRYWLQNFGVAGFRFDLAASLGRDMQSFSSRAALFQAMQQDPILQRARLIAEPWDCGPNGYQLGHFPAGFAEWNDQFRDAMRRYWLARGGTASEFAKRFCGSSDHFAKHGRLSSASINFVVAHDGFSLLDTVSYSHKHNHANGEDNRDGRNDELCSNFGVEGASSDPAINAQRLRIARALQACALLAQGTPMLLAGSELGHSQQGNNNAYCQDNAISWLNWRAAQPDLLKLTQAVSRLRQTFALLRHEAWFSDQIERREQARVIWCGGNGQRMYNEDWHRDAPMILQAAYFAPQAALPEFSLIFNPTAIKQSAQLYDWGSAVAHDLCFDSSGEILENYLSLDNPVALRFAQVRAPAHAILLVRHTRSTGKPPSNHQFGTSHV